MQEKRNMIRLINEQKVLEEVFNNGPISRSEISKNLGINKATVSEIVLDQIEKQFLTESGQGNSTKNGGRRPTFVKLNTDFGFVINFDLGHDYLDCMVNRLDGNIVSVNRYDLSAATVDERLGLMVDLARTAGQHEMGYLLGVSVAIHGIVHKNKVLYMPFIDGKGIDIAKYLGDKLGVPVVLENEANLSVIYERDFESHDEIDNIVCISIHKGIGAGIIINNKLYTGKQGEAGEIGHTVVYDEKFLKHKQPTTIESICSEDAIRESVRQEMGLSAVRIGTIVDAYRDGNPIVLGILEKFCYYIANVIYNTFVTLDPKRIALNSRLIASLPELLEKIQDNIPSLTESENVVSLVGDVRKATLLGGCSRIIHEILNVESGQLVFY